jgi:hypothetical protein
MSRIGPFMQTYTGRAFYPIDPRTSEIDIRDIAHSLAMQCRYAGHSRFHYSVAQHCVLLSNVVPAEHALDALMHDAAEAYLVDVPRPVKSQLAGYAGIEKKLEIAIAQKFMLNYPWPKCVKEADERILNDERDQLLGIPPLDWPGDKAPLGVKIFRWEPHMAETAFLDRYRELMGMA